MQKREFMEPTISQADIEKLNKYNPATTINWLTVTNLCKLQCTRDEIASVLDVSIKTLEKICKKDHHVLLSEYIAHNSGSGRASIRRKQYEVATSGSVPMLIHLGKAMLGQSESVKHDITSKGKQLGSSMDLSKLSDDELAFLKRIAEKTEA